MTWTIWKTEFGRVCCWFRGRLQSRSHANGQLSRGFAIIVSLLAAIFLANAQNTAKFALQSKSAEFWKLIDHDAKLSQVATGFGFTEGPVWDESGFVYVSDETLNKIFRVYSDDRKEELIALGDPDGNTFDRQHHLIDRASELRAVIEVTPQGRYKILADHYEGKKLNTRNDVVVGPDGALYFTGPHIRFRRWRETGAFISGCLPVR
jgi:gluconolactonase